MNFWVTINEREYHVRLQNGQVFLDDEEQPAATLTPLNSNGLHLLRSASRDVEIHLHTIQPGTVEVLLGGQRILARVETQQQRARHAEAVPEAGALVAPMPGLLVALHAVEGEPVACGQVLAVIESMKMQMQIRAPIAGQVAKISVQPGAQVEKGALLIQITA